MTTKYALKIQSEFDEKEIQKNLKIINVDKEENINIFDTNLNQDESKSNKNFLSHIIINLNHKNSSVNFKGRYKSQNNLCDVFCEVRHNADNTKSNLDIKGISSENGKIISRSNIFVREDIKNVDGFEKAKFLYVVDENQKAGEIDAIPNLDIFSNEVKVGHAMSIAKIKKEDIWYLNLHGEDKFSAEKEFENIFLK